MIKIEKDVELLMMKALLYHSRGIKFHFMDIRKSRRVLRRRIIRLRLFSRKKIQHKEWVDSS